jgi:hypothetical protein
MGEGRFGEVCVFFGYAFGRFFMLRHSFSEERNKMIFFAPCSALLGARERYHMQDYLEGTKIELKTDIAIYTFEISILFNLILFNLISFETAHLRVATVISMEK